MEFHQQLKQLREQLNLTQDELAIRLNVSRSAIAKWEQGKGMPSLDLLKTLALFFHCSIDELLGDRGLSLIQTKQRRNFWITASVAILAIITTVVSTTLYVIELKKAQQNSYVKEIVRLNSVTLTNNTYEISYQNDAGEQRLSFAQDLVSFRNLNDYDQSLNNQDYVYIERSGNEVSRLKVIDNAITPSLKGYRINFNDTVTDYEYYYRTYFNHTGQYDYLMLESDIPSIADASTNTVITSYFDHTYQHIKVNHVIYVKNDLDPGSRFDCSFDFINLDGSVAPSQVSTGVYVEHLSSISLKFDGYLNGFAYLGDDYHLRDVISYYFTLKFVETIDKVTIRQYKDDQTLLREDILSSSTIGLFTIETEAGYLKYYENDNSRGRTLETGESKKLFINNGTPLPTIFELKFGE